MRVLLFSTPFYGHPVVYCRVIAKILLERGCEVVIAAPGLQNFDFSAWSELGEFMGAELQTMDLGGDISPVPKPVSVEELLAVQRRYDVNTTLFVHADHFRDEFVRIAERRAPRLQGKTVGIFSLTARWCPGEDALTGRKVSWRGPTVRRTLGNLKRAVLNRTESDKYFFEHVLLKRKPLSTILVKDERVSESFGSSVHWMPEIYKVFGERINDAAAIQHRRIADEYGQFLAANPEREVLLYFGNAAWYKGYDQFLRLALADRSTLCVHCGAPDLGDGLYEMDVAGARAALRKEGRLFETGEYLQSQQLIEEFFLSAKRLVSTHRLSGTSGTILQALDLGMPVLTTELGLIGHRTREHGVGLTYRYGDFEDLCAQWKAFREAEPERFSPMIGRFMERFGEQAVVNHFSSVLLDG